MTTKMIKVWATKYALSREIEACVVEVDSDRPGMAVKREGALLQFFHGEGSEWHRTPEAALAKAEAMRQAKISSLKEHSEA